MSALPPSRPDRPPWKRRAHRAGCLVFLVATFFVVRPAFHLATTWMQDHPDTAEEVPGRADDASRMNSTAVREVVPVEGDAESIRGQIRDLLARARREKLSISIAGARHSMGGHTISPDGIVLETAGLAGLDFDAGRKILTAGAGARWRDVIPFLDAKGYSVAVMQSNNDFSVGGSLSANCHGWQHSRPPIASTVDSFRLMTADGQILRCSRQQNRDLFGLVLGGYGLFGVILDVDLRVVANERYRPRAEVVPAQDYPREFQARVRTNPLAGMAYGRLCVVPGEGAFLQQAILTVLERDPTDAEPIPALESSGYRTLRRQVYRGQLASDYGKRLRWNTEMRIMKSISSRPFSRNQLLDDGTDLFAERSANRTDVLHEYFIPTERFGDFLARIRLLLPREPFELLNITIRDLRADDDSFLRYADRDVFGLVFLFNCPREAAADEAMGRLTRELIDAALACKGRYYLPYRLHATQEQFDEAYPNGKKFFAAKRKWDPDGVFDNLFFRRYGGS